MAMMDRYYYLVAQLPTLVFGREPEITVEEFLTEAAKWLSEKDYRVLSRVDIQETAPQPGDPGALRRFKAFEFALRNELTLWRRTRGTEQEYRPTGFSLAALREGTPLDVEMRLLRWRWDLVDEEEREHHFDLESLVLYLIKLQILRRASYFDPEAGMKVFQNLCEAEA